MDSVKLLLAIRTRLLNARYCQRHAKTKQLLSPDNNQTIFKDRKPENQTEPTKPWTEYYYTDTQG